MEKRNIILIGMPGAGKSTLGVLLAKAMGYGFLDTDLIIQEREGRRLHEIMEQEGLERFLSIEEEVNASLLVSRTVIAPGGSAIFSERAMLHFKELGTIIYLKVSLRELKKRLSDLKQRGVVCKEGQGLEEIFEERRPYYEKYADICVDVSNRGIGSILHEIKEKVKNVLQQENNLPE